MGQIRLALIGLSQSAKTSWASQAHLPYLLSPRGERNYKISALLNSSVAAAERAIEFYNLPAETKAYGSPEDLANDPDIDLVVWKDVYVEWPLAENVARASELADLAKGRTIVGLQGQVAPVIVKLREVLEGGEYGKVLSSSVQAFTPWSARDSISAELAYFLEKKVGGNAVTIAFGHMIDYVHAVLGEFSSSNAHLQIQRPVQDTLNKSTGERIPHTSDVPDLISLHGTLSPSSFTTPSTTLTVNFRRGPPFPGTTPFVWTINCELGEIQVTSDIGPSIHSEGEEHVFPIKVNVFETGEVKEVEWKWEAWQEEMKPKERNIAMLYDLYAQGKVVPGFGEAVRRHEELDGMLWGKE